MSNYYTLESELWQAINGAAVELAENGHRARTAYVNPQEWKREMGDITIYCDHGEVRLAYSWLVPVGEVVVLSGGHKGMFSAAARRRWRA